MATPQVSSARSHALDAFRARAPQPSGKRDLALYAFGWLASAEHGQEYPDMNGVDELETTCNGDIRVVFAPRDVPHPRNVGGLIDLFERCEIPSAFVDESLREVSQSFAVRRDADGTIFVWFHLLCKNLAIFDEKIVHGQTVEHDVDMEEDHKKEALNHSNANFTWLKPGFVLKIKPTNTSAPKPCRTSTSSSDITLAAVPVQAKVELFCFGAPPGLRDRFQQLKLEGTCNEILQDPYMLLEIVLDEMHKVLDSTVRTLANVFGRIEIKTLSMACKPGKAAKELAKGGSKDHFTGLHNLAKHCIYLRENCEAALATLNDLRDHHKSVIGHTPHLQQQLTLDALKYRKTLFQSTQSRLASLDARMANIIALSFHIVTQGDSRLMQSESQSMKTIAVMTLLFMPLSTVASVFGSQFMMLQEESPYRLTVSQDFWLLWVIAVPLTAIVMTFWRVWYLDARGRLVDEVHLADGARSYKGWKTLPETLRMRILGTARVREGGRQQKV